jgi:hypothetical protein
MVAEKVEIITKSFKDEPAGALDRDEALNLPLEPADNHTWN